MPELPGTLKPPRSASAPGSPVAGQMYYDTGASQLKWWNGSAWIVAADTGGALPADTVIAGATRIISNKQAAGDANPSWVVRGDGKMEWGYPGSAFDVSLIHSTTNQLKVVGGGLALDTGLLVDATNGANRLYFGGAFDCALWRAGAKNMNTDSVVWASAGGVNQCGIGTLGPGSTAAIQFSWNGGTDTFLYRNAASQLRISGSLVLDTTLYFGSALDTNLYRSAADTLKTDDSFVAAGPSFSATAGLLSGSYGRLTTRVGGPDQIQIGDRAGDGTTPYIAFGSAGDTNLYRSAADVLKTDDSFVVGNNLVTTGYAYIDNGNTGQRLYFGSAGDTSLYRSASNALSTPGYFTAGLQIYSSFGAANQIQLATDGRIYFGSANDTSLYRLLAGYLVTPGGFRLDAAGNASQLQFGASGDTSLYRNGANQLSTPGSFLTGSFVSASGNITAKSGVAATQVTIGDNGGGFGWLAFGNPADNNIYRWGANFLMSDSSLWCGYNRATGTTWLAVTASGDAQPRIGMLNNGYLYFGDGQASPETSLYRAGANQLRTAASLQTDKFLVSRNEAAVSNILTLGNGATGASQAGRGVEVRLGAGDTYYAAIKAKFANSSPSYLNPELSFWTMLNTYLAGSELERLRIAADGKLWINPSAGLDTNLYRAAAGVLQTDGQFQLTGRVFSGAAGSGGIWVDGGGSQFFGSLGSTNMGLYNAGWNLVLTNAGQVQLPVGGSTGGLLIGGDANLYRSPGGVLKTDGSFASMNLSTSLPASPVDGQIWFFQAAAGIIWQFRYNASSASSYKWEFVGGSDFGAIDSVANTAPGGWTSQGPTLTVPRNGEYEIMTVAFGDSNGLVAANTSVEWGIGYGTTSVTAGHRYTQRQTVDASLSQGMNHRWRATLTAGNVVSVYGYASGWSMRMQDRQIYLRPVRVS